jgi:hypothetical protein
MDLSVMLVDTFFTGTTRTINTAGGRENDQKDQAA